MLLQTSVRTEWNSNGIQYRDFQSITFYQWPAHGLRENIALPTNANNFKSKRMYTCVRIYREKFPIEKIFTNSKIRMSILFCVRFAMDKSTIPIPCTQKLNATKNV